MRTSSLMMVLLVAAALAGCTGGTSNEGQLPNEPSDTSSGSSTPSGTRGPSADRGGGDTKSYDAYLEVSATNGTAPLNVTLTFGATWQDNGQRSGRDGNGTAGNGTGNGNRGGASANQTSSGPAANATGNQTGNQTGGTGNPSGAGNGGNGTPNDGSHPVNGGHDVTWTLEVRLMDGSGSSSGNSTGNGSTGNGTSGNGTGNQTGNQTSGNSTSSSQTSTGAAGNQTGNQTSSTNSTTGAPSGTGNGTGNGTSSGGNGTTAEGTLIVSFNGTGADLPGNETVLLNETGSYTVTFTVTTEDGDTLVRTASIAVEPLPPGSPLGNETRTFEDSFVASAPAPGLCYAEDFEWALNATFGGHPADVSHVNVTLEASGFDQLGAVEMMLLAPNGTELASGDEIHLEGPFANGTYVLRAESCASADVEYTITAIANYATKGGFA